jgi:nickel-type superoxide dismutase maturation protease
MRSLLPLQRVRVADTSMQPALQPGDRLLVNRWSRPRPGDIVVFRDPESTKRLLIKRLNGFTPDGRALVRGDNANVSRDSRHFGAVPVAAIVGRAVYRYLPGARRGRL